MSAKLPSGPLTGLSVIVTRARAQSSGLVRLLAEAGALAVEVPGIEIVDPADKGLALAEALGRLGDNEWIVFTAANAVEACWRRLDATAPFAGIKVAAIGAATAAALLARGVAADLVPADYVAESLVESFPSPKAGEGSVLLPCAAGAREVLATGLRAKGWRVEVVEAYRTVGPPPDKAAARTGAEADVITFTSSSAVTGYLDLAGLDGVPPVVACIGPVTARTALEAGLEVEVVAKVHTAAGLVAALVEWARGRPTPRGPK